MREPIHFHVLMALLIVGIAGCSDDNGINKDSGGSGKDGANDDPSLVGTWKGTEVGDTAPWTWTFTATDMTAESGGTEVYRGTYVIFPGENPKRVEATITQSTVPTYIGQTTRGIYKFEGNDRLIYSANEPGVAATPSSFTPGGGTRVFELQRQ